MPRLTAVTKHTTLSQILLLSCCFGTFMGTLRVSNGRVTCLSWKALSKDCLMACYLPADDARCQNWRAVARL